MDARRRPTSEWQYLASQLARAQAFQSSISPIRELLNSVISQLERRTPQGHVLLPGTLFDECTLNGCLGLQRRPVLVNVGFVVREDWIVKHGWLFGG
jgi:hypothetical protein